MIYKEVNMVKFCLFASLFILTFATPSFSQNLSNAQTPTKTNKALIPGKVAFVDLQAFNTEILEMKLQYDKTQKEFQPNFNELKSLDEQLAKLQEELKSNALNEKTYREKLNLFQTSKKELDIKYEYYKQAFQARLEQYTAPIKEKIFKSLEDYSQQRGIIAVFSLPDSNNLVFYDNSNNITEDFIKEYNRHTPEPK